MDSIILMGSVQLDILCESVNPVEGLKGKSGLLENRCPCGFGNVWILQPHTSPAASLARRNGNTLWAGYWICVVTHTPIILNPGSQEKGVLILLPQCQAPVVCGRVSGSTSWIQANCPFSLPEQRLPQEHGASARAAGDGPAHPHPGGG